MNLPRSLGIACVGLICASVLCGCLTDAAPSLSEVKKFDAYRVYYAGEEVAGLPLENLSKGGWEGNLRVWGWSFIYGRCDSPPTGDSGCSAPLEIQIWSTCGRWFSSFDRKRRLYDFRGAKATGSGNGIEEPAEIFTGRTTVVVFAGDGRIAKAVARQLRDVRAAKPQSLPPPAPGSLWGKLPCQQRPG